MPKRKTRITSKQRAARKRNIEIARRAKKGAVKLKISSAHGDHVFKSKRLALGALERRSKGASLLQLKDKRYMVTSHSRARSFAKQGHKNIRITDWY